MEYYKQNTMLSHLLFFIAVRLEDILSAERFLPWVIINLLGDTAQWCHAKSLMFDPEGKAWGQWCWYNPKPIDWANESKQD